MQLLMFMGDMSTRQVHCSGQSPPWGALVCLAGCYTQIEHCSICQLHVSGWNQPCLRSPWLVEYIQKGWAGPSLFQCSGIKNVYVCNVCILSKFVRMDFWFELIFFSVMPKGMIDNITSHFTIYLCSFSWCICWRCGKQNHHNCLPLLPLYARFLFTHVRTTSRLVPPKRT